MAPFFHEAIRASFTPTPLTDPPSALDFLLPRWVFTFPAPEGEYTLEFEPSFGGGYDIGLYEKKPDQVYPNLILKEKIPIIPNERKGS